MSNRIFILVAILLYSGLPADAQTIQQLDSMAKQTIGKRLPYKLKDIRVRVHSANFLLPGEAPYPQHLDKPNPGIAAYIYDGDSLQLFKVARCRVNYYNPETKTSREVLLHHGRFSTVYGTEFLKEIGQDTNYELTKRTWISDVYLIDADGNVLKLPGAYNFITGKQIKR